MIPAGRIDKDPSAGRLLPSPPGSSTGGRWDQWAEGYDRIRRLPDRTSSPAVRVLLVLDEKTHAEIVRVTERLWSRLSRAGDVDPFIERDEPGHGLANYVEGETVKALRDALGPGATFQLDRTGPGKRKRSMGDIWIESGGIFNPVNIKTGVKEPGRPSSGQPNLVSLNKLTEAVVQHWIDSYYLLMVRFITTQPPEPVVTLVDLLHIVEDYVAFDSGPGQMMLKARRFDDPPPTKYDRVPAKAALEHLLKVREEKNQRMFSKRERDLATLQAKVATFDPTAPIEQSELRLDTSR